LWKIKAAGIKNRIKAKAPILVSQPRKTESPPPASTTMAPIKKNGTKGIRFAAI
jgi:hypothetical protein